MKAHYWILATTIFVLALYLINYTNTALAASLMVKAHVNCPPNTGTARCPSTSDFSVAIPGGNPNWFRPDVTGNPPVPSNGGTSQNSRAVTVELQEGTNYRFRDNVPAATPDIRRMYPSQFQGFTDYQGQCAGTVPHTFAPGSVCNITFVRTLTPTQVKVDKRVDCTNTDELGPCPSINNFGFQVFGTYPSPDSPVNFAPPLCTPYCTVFIGPGPYHVTETPRPQGDFRVSYSNECTGTILPGQTMNCTITNTRINPGSPINPGSQTIEPNNPCAGNINPNCQESQQNCQNTNYAATHIKICGSMALERKCEPDFAKSHPEYCASLPKSEQNLTEVNQTDQGK